MLNSIARCLHLRSFSGHCLLLVAASLCVAPLKVSAQSDSALVASRDSSVSTRRIVAGALAGAAVGAAVSLPLLPNAFQHGGGLSSGDLIGGVAIFTITESVGLAMGAYAANHRHGAIVRAAFTAVGAGLAGVILMTGPAKTVGGGAYVLVPLVQVAAVNAVLR